MVTFSTAHGTQKIEKHTACLRSSFALVSGVAFTGDAAAVLTSVLGSDSSSLELFTLVLPSPLAVRFGAFEKADMIAPRDLPPFFSLASACPALAARGAADAVRSSSFSAALADAALGAA